MSDLVWFVITGFWMLWIDAITIILLIILDKWFK